VKTDVKEKNLKLWRISIGQTSGNSRKIFVLNIIKSYLALVILSVLSCCVKNKNLYLNIYIHTHHARTHARSR